VIGLFRAQEVVISCEEHLQSPLSAGISVFVEWEGKRGFEGI